MRDKYSELAKNLYNEVYNQHLSHGESIDILAQALRESVAEMMMEIAEDQKQYAWIAEPAPHIIKDCCREREIAMAMGLFRSLKSRAAALRQPSTVLIPTTITERKSA